MFTDDNLLSPANLARLRQDPPASTRPGAQDPRPSTTDPAPRIRGQFLRGPIPMALIERAAASGGLNAVAVVLAIRFQAGRQAPTDHQGSGEWVRLTNSLVARFGVTRKAKYAALRSLEEDGLLEVRRPPKKTPEARIVEQ